MQAGAGRHSLKPNPESRIRVSADAQPLWQFDFAEVTGYNLESRGRKEVNRLLAAGWRLLHVYTLRYEEKGVWRELPMAILGRLRNGSLLLSSGELCRQAVFSVSPLPHVDNRLRVCDQEASQASPVVMVAVGKHGKVNGVDINAPSGGVIHEMS